MIQELHATWRARRALIVGGTDAMTLFMQALLGELGAKTARLVPSAGVETLHRSLTEGRVSAIIVPCMRALCGGGAEKQLSALSTLLVEAREAGVPLCILMSDDSVYRAEGRPWNAQENDPIGGETPQGLIQSILDLYACGVSRGLCGDAVSVQCIRHLPCLGGGHPAVRQYSAWCRAGETSDALCVQHPSMQGVFIHPLDACCGALLLGARFFLGDTGCTGPFNLGACSENLVPNRTAALRFTHRHCMDRPIHETQPPNASILPLPDGAKARLLCGARCFLSGEEALDQLLSLCFAEKEGFDARSKEIAKQTQGYLKKLT